MHRIESSNVVVVDGKNMFTNGPPGTTMNAEWPNAVQEEVCNVVEKAGLQVLTKDTDTHNQLWEALQVLGRPYDLIVTSQVVFNSMIERIGANHYQIKSNYKSVFFKNITGGYNATSWLTNGDLWGYISTNKCQHIDFENGAYINDTNTKFYMHYNTDYGRFNNIVIKGGGSAAAIQYSHYHDAQYCLYENCGVDGRKSSVTVKHFYGNSANPEHQQTTKFLGCYVINDQTTAGTCYAFNTLYNLTSCFIDGINVAASFFAFYSCRSITNPMIGTFIAGVANYGTAFYDCYSITGASIYTIANTGLTTLFENCRGISGINIVSVTSVGALIGFLNCSGVSGIYIDTLTSTGGNVYGFQNCAGISGMSIGTIQHTGGVATKSAYGFFTCSGLSGIYITQLSTNGAGGTAEGLKNCTYGAAIAFDPAIIVNSGNDWMDTVDAQVVNKVSLPSLFT